MEDYQIENEILTILSPIEPIHSNKVFSKLRTDKSRYHEIRDKMIKEKWIKDERKGRNLLLTRLNFEADKFKGNDWTRTTQTNCNNILKFFIKNKPVFRVRENKPFKIKKALKMHLDYYFQELDRQMIVCTRVVNAEALGLITSTRSKKIQKECIDFVKEYVKKLLNDHKEFKDEIKEYAQSQLRTVQFKI